MKSYMDLLMSSLRENAEGTGGSVIDKIADYLNVERKEAEERLASLRLPDQHRVVDAASRGDTAAVFLLMGKSDHDKKLKEDTALDKLPPAPYVPPNADQEDQDGNITPNGPQRGKPAFNPQDPTQGMQGQPGQQQPVPGRAGTPQQQQQQQQQQLNPGQPPGQPLAGQPQMQPAGQPGAQPKPSGTITRPTGTQGTGPRLNQPPVQETYVFQPGDEVEIEGRGDGVVSGVDDGPHGSDTVGVLDDDGSLEMVKKSQLKLRESNRMKENEHAMGLTRMLALAGVKHLREDEDERPTKPWEKKEEEETEAKSEQPEQPKSEPASVTIQVHDMQTGGTHEFGDKSKEQAAPAPVEEKACPREAIMDALSTIEQHLPELRLGDFKDVRKRLEAIQNTVLETAMNRRRKL